MKKCEKCGIDIDGSFGSGKFCSRSCANSRTQTEKDKLKKSKSAKSSEKVKNANRIKNRVKLEKINTTDLCSYGCGQIAIYRNKSGNLMCDNNANKCPKLREINSKAVKKAYDEGIKKPSSEVYKNLSQEIKDKMAWSRGMVFPNDKIYNNNCNYKITHKKYLIVERGYVCEKCNNTEWLGKLITLEIDHIDGNNKNNTKENLKLLCPNCHAQTPTWRRAKSAIFKKVSDEDFIDALKKENNIYRALIKVGLAPKGANYKRANKLKKENNI